MDEDGLVLALCKVEDTHEQRELLQLRSRSVGTIDERASEVHKRVDEERTEVLDDEDRSPGDLGACTY